MERLLLPRGDSGTKLNAQRKSGGSQAQPVSLSVGRWLCHRNLTTPLSIGHAMMSRGQVKLARIKLRSSRPPQL